MISNIVVVVLVVLLPALLDALDLEREGKSIKATWFLGRVLFHGAVIIGLVALAFLLFVLLNIDVVMI
jgi:hypothetical protein